MTLISFMFSSVYDRSSLAVMAVGLAINLIIDVLKARTKDTRGR